MPFLLDSTVLIDCLRGRPAAQRVERLWQSGEQPLISSINIEEVVRGLRSGEVEAARKLFQALRVLPVGESEAWQAGRWRCRFAAEGITLSQADCLIAATAYKAEAKLVTGNPAHFPMPELNVEEWPVGR